MKKILAILLCLSILLSLTACGKQAQNTAASDSAEEVDVQVGDASEPTSLPYSKNPLTGLDTDQPGFRPVAIMLQNGSSALPQWGIGDADLLIEGLVQAKTSALMAVYANVNTVEKVGPVAPLNDLMLQLVLPLNAIPVHNGISVYASNLLNLLQYQDLDGTYIGTISFDYDRDRKAVGYNDEFCWYTKTELISNGLATYGTPDRGELTPLFQFNQDTHPQKPEDTAQSIAITYSQNNITCFWFDSGSQKYTMSRDQDGPVIDANNGSGVELDNLLVLCASAEVKDDGFTRDYDLSSGVGLLFSRGGWQEILWQKGGATGALLLYDTEGKELSVNTGRTYIGIYGDFAGQSLMVYDTEGNRQNLPTLS